MFLPIEKTMMSYSQAANDIEKGRYKAPVVKANG